MSNDDESWRLQASVEGLGYVSSEAQYQVLHHRNEQYKAMMYEHQAMSPEPFHVPRIVIYLFIIAMFCFSIPAIFGSISQGNVFTSLLLCSLVAVFAIAGSVYATQRLAISMKRISSTQVSNFAQRIPEDRSITPGTSSSPVGVSLTEAVQLRNLLTRTMSPNPIETYYWAITKFPGASRDELAQQVIKAEAGKCGFVGFIAGVPGFVALPIALPVDLFMTGRIQAAMIQTLALIYEYEEEDDAAQQRWWIVLLGGGGLARALTELGIKVIGSPILRAVPVLGAFVGYGVSYGLARTAGKAAMENFSGRLRHRLTALNTSTISGRLQEVARTTGQLAYQQRQLAAVRLQERGYPLKEQVVPPAQEPIQHETGAAPSALSGESEVSLAVACPSCGASNLSTYKHCAECGTRIANTENRSTI